VKLVDARIGYAGYSRDFAAPGDRRRFAAYARLRGLPIERAELGPPKQDYARSAKLRIVWEGQTTTLPNLQVIREPLNDLRDRVELHVVTDPVIHRYFARFVSYPSMRALDGIECDKHFHRWNRETFSRHVTACDAAVIPIERANALWWGKPENKLVLLWQLGMPVLTTATPVYRRVMEAAAVDMSCATAAEWGGQLERLTVADASELERIGTRCRGFAEQTYSTEEFLNRFDAAFAAVGFEVSPTSPS
jgi:hypothetical protein